MKSEPDRERTMPYNPLIEVDDLPAESKQDGDSRKWDVITALAALVGIVLIVLLILTT